MRAVCIVVRLKLARPRVAVERIYFLRVSQFSLVNECSKCRTQKNPSDEIVYVSFGGRREKKRAALGCFLLNPFQLVLARRSDGSLVIDRDFCQHLFLRLPLTRSRSCRCQGWGRCQNVSKSIDRSAIPHQSKGKRPRHEWS